MRKNQNFEVKKKCRGECCTLSLFYLGLFQNRVMYLKTSHGRSCDIHLATSLLILPAVGEEPHFYQLLNDITKKKNVHSNTDIPKKA